MPQKRTLKALIAEDNPNDAELLLLELSRGGFQVEAERVDTPETFKAALEKEPWQVIFSDHSMPHFNSFQALDLRNRHGSDTPFIILSGTMGEDLAVEAMKAGASDYFVKGKLTRLTAAVQRELQEAQEREIRRKTEWELEHFVASLTHDLRTPILAELRVLELLASGTAGPLTADQQEMIQELIQSNQFVQHMVNNILFAYKYKQHAVQLKKEKTDLVQFISTLSSSVFIRSLTKEKRQELILQPPSEALPPVEVDQNEIRRVFMNLVKNAFDYTPPGGAVTLSFAQQGDFIRVGIQDTGPGVDPEIEPYLFTPYTTSAVRRYRQIGIGLGLYLSKQIVETHGGRIGFERQKEGSFFYFDLPISGRVEATA